MTGRNAALDFLYRLELAPYFGLIVRQTLGIRNINMVHFRCSLRTCYLHVVH